MSFREWRRPGGVDAVSHVFRQRRITRRVRSVSLRLSTVLMVCIAILRDASCLVLLNRAVFEDGRRNVLLHAARDVVLK